MAYHKNTKTIAITLKNRNKSINAWMMKEEDRNEYFHALAPLPFLVVLRQLSFKEKVQIWSCIHTVWDNDHKIYSVA